MPESGARLPTCVSPKIGEEQTSHIRANFREADFSILMLWNQHSDVTYKGYRRDRAFR